jgi:hypothetical protein
MRLRKVERRRRLKKPYSPEKANKPTKNEGN